MPPTKGGKRVAPGMPTPTAAATSAVAQGGRGKRVPAKSGAQPAQPVKGGSVTPAWGTMGSKGAARRRRPSGRRSGGGKGGKSLPPRPPKSSARRKRHYSRWSTFIHRTLKHCHDKVGISSRAMSIMGSFVEDMFERIHGESVQVAKINSTKTLTAREVQTSARLILPGELCKHAMSEGTKAVATYNSAVQASKMLKS